jgi:TolB-like protein/class 3 adenylate cyclase/Flp pilus assembly protein TadD
MTATRRLAAILAADVAGYSRLMEADEEGTLAQLRAIRTELFDPTIAAHNGRLVKTTGDGLLVEFASVVDALRCATEVQADMAERNATTGAGKRIEFRIGIHQGDIVVEDGDIFGDGVNIAARLEGLARPGGICVSARVQEDAVGKLALAFEDLGEQSFKNISRPVRAFAIGSDAGASIPLNAAPTQPTRAHRLFSLLRPVMWWALPQPNVPAVATPTASPPSLGGLARTPVPRLSFAVLPFENLSRDPDQEYFADGITDDLTTDLSRISGSFVIARNTAFTYKGKPADAKQIGRDLGVRYVIEGSVRRSGGRVQVNVQLIDAETGAHVWADRFDTDRQDIAEAQSEITGRLARSLNVELLRDVSRRIEQQRGINPDAGDLVLRGWALWQRPFSIPNLQQAQRSFQQALALDQRSTEARIGLAMVLVQLVTNGWSSTIQQDKSLAEQLLFEALAQDPNNSMAHYAMGQLRRLEDRLAEALTEFEAAVALDHNNAWALQLVGGMLRWLGRPQEGIPYMEKAIRLNPHDPNIAAFYWVLAHSHLLLGHVDQSIDLFRKAIAANRELWFLHLNFAGALGLRGDLDEARAELSESLRLYPDINSLARLRQPTNPDYLALAEKTLYLGLRRAGFPE